MILRKSLAVVPLLLLATAAFAQSSTPPAAPPPAAYPAPAIAPPLPAPKIDDAGQPPIEADDPFNEADPNRTPANMLTPERMQAILDNEQSRFWISAHDEVFGANGGTLMEIYEARSKVDQDINSMVLTRARSKNAVTRKLLALTFDDGPHTATTQPILNVLKQYHVPATFFFVGAMAERHPELVRAAFQDGHSIGNHTYHHLTLVKLDEADAVTEIKACGNILRAITGQTPHLFRPPGGQYTSEIAEDATVMGYTTVLWTGDPGDYERLDPATIAQRTLKTAHPGGIIILHSGVWQTVRALPYIIESLRSQGYTLVSIDQMIKENKSASAVRTASVAPNKAAHPSH